MNNSELNVFKKDVSDQFAGVRSDIKDLTKALRDLIILDGDIKRQSDVVARVGREVEDHEKRIRSLEVTGAGTKKTVTLMDKVFERGALLLIGAVLMKVINTVVG
jgi:hypothetical protein